MSIRSYIGPLHLIARFAKLCFSPLHVLARLAFSSMGVEHGGKLGGVYAILLGGCQGALVRLSGLPPAWLSTWARNVQGPEASGRNLSQAVHGWAHHGSLVVDAVLPTMCLLPSVWSSYQLYHGHEETSIRHHPRSLNDAENGHFGLDPGLWSCRPVYANS